VLGGELVRALDGLLRFYGEFVPTDCHGLNSLLTNTIQFAFSLPKRGIIGTWHKISSKLLPASTKWRSGSTTAKTHSYF
jgi:hypothetical protein